MLFDDLRAKIAAIKAKRAEEQHAKDLENLVIGTELAGGDKITKGMVEELTNGKGED